MTCKETLALVEAIAAGDLEVDDRIRAHFESCPRCAAELASARRLESLLQARGAVAAPPQFVPTVLARIRNDRWRSEQRVDRIFNVAIFTAVLLVAGSLAAMVNINWVIGLGGWIWGALVEVSGRAVQEAQPVLLTYVAAACLLMSALGMWWWAERRLSL